MTIDSNFGRKTGHVTIPPTPPDIYSKFLSFPEGMLVKFKGEDGNEKIGKVTIKDDGMTALVGKENVPVDINTVQLYGGKSRRKSRKNKSRRYRRV
jgi:hypothetical protein